MHPTFCARASCGATATSLTRSCLCRRRACPSSTVSAGASGSFHSGSIGKQASRCGESASMADTLEQQWHVVQLMEQACLVDIVGAVHERMSGALWRFPHATPNPGRHVRMQRPSKDCRQIWKRSYRRVATATAWWIRVGAARLSPRSRLR